MELFIRRRFGDSGRSEVNFYQGNESLGISDNHRMAFYHFAKYGINGSHFIHIDTHPDFSPLKDECHQAIQENPSYLNTPLDFIELKRNGSDLEAIQWGNWIEGLRIVFPELISTACICVQDKAVLFKTHWPEANVESEPEAYPVIIPSSDRPTLFSFDIDYYFSSSGIYCELRIDEQQALNHFQETLCAIKQFPNCLPFIALSPTCCGGWENTLPFTQIVDEVFETDITEIIEAHI